MSFFSSHLVVPFIEIAVPRCGAGYQGVGLDAAGRHSGSDRGRDRRRSGARQHRAWQKTLAVNRATTGGTAGVRARARRRVGARPDAAAAGAAVPDAAGSAPATSASIPAATAGCSIGRTSNTSPAAAFSIRDELAAPRRRGVRVDRAAAAGSAAGAQLRSIAISTRAASRSSSCRRRSSRRPPGDARGDRRAGGQSCRTRRTPSSSTWLARQGVLRLRSGADARRRRGAGAAVSRRPTRTGVPRRWSSSPDAWRRSSPSA